MAADRSRLAAALAYKQAEEERRRRMFESIPEPAGQGLPQAPERPMGWNDYLENLSIGLGRGAVSNLEGIKGMVISPVETLKGVATGITEAVRNPRIVAEALKQTGQRAMSGPLGLGEVIGENVNMMRIPGKPVMAELDVYHGTPHRFPATEANPLGEFDASKIGTGEGAQAYGHGVYLAEGQNVGKGYQERLSGSGYRNAATDEIVDSGKAWQAATKAVQDAGVAHPDRAGQIASQIQNWVDSGRTSRSFLLNRQVPKQLEPAYQAAIDSFDNLQLNKGSLYKADLPDEMIDRMLDWDKPLSEQPTAVREHVMRYMNVKEGGLPADMSVINSGGGKYVVVQEKPPLPGATFGIPRTITKGPRADSPEAAIKAYWDNLKGEDFYKTLSGDVGEGAAASEYLRSLGIPGVRYLDAGSRGQGGSGTRNFVVFPGEEKKVRILERDGKKVADMLQRATPTSAQVEVDIYPLRSDPNTLYLSKIAVPKDQQGRGLGSQAMQEIIDKADAEGKRVVLSPSTEYGASSVGRLKDFYKRFGFVENKGRNKNYAISESMYRDPKKQK